MENLFEDINKQVLKALQNNIVGTKFKGIKSITK